METAKESKTVAIGHGLRERLLLSFIAISSFAVVAAVVGNYAFYAIGQSLHQVTERSVPPAIAALELAQRTERIVAAGPALLAVTNSAEFDGCFLSARPRTERSQAPAVQAPERRTDRREAGRKFRFLRSVSANLESLKLVVQTRIAAAGRRSALVRATLEAYNSFAPSGLRSSTN